MFSPLFSVFSALLFSFFFLAIAAPVKPTEFLAFAPTITLPTAKSVWRPGSNQMVSWLTSNVPIAAQDYTLTILLGFFANNSENLNFTNPLGTQVPIMSGSVMVTVPHSTPNGTNYTVVVIGDSGDASPAFTITN